MPVGPRDPTHGVLDFPRALQNFQLDRATPAEALSPWVECYWEVVWDLPPGQTHRQTNLSHACLNFAVEGDGAWLYGVPGPTFVRELTGQGRVFGVKFRPGAFYPWLGRPLRPLFDRRVPLDILGGDWTLWSQEIRAEPEFPKRIALTNGFLGARRPSAPGEGCRCACRMAEDRSLVRVEDACRALGQDIRSLQRLFSREVGVTPKDLLRRYRLMEAAERLAREPQLTGADLALTLGYADQAHFIRDYRAVTGVPPESYRRRQAPPLDLGGSA